MKHASTLRILDASANRALEGLRIVEDFARFVVDDSYLTVCFKQLRHDLAGCLGKLPPLQRHATRNTEFDVGTTINTAAETTRRDPWHVCSASCERVKQSLRSLEEYGKLLDPTLSQQVESLRYRFYTLERCLGIGLDSRSRLEGICLCVLVDGQQEQEFEHLVLQLVQAQVGMIQLRAKSLVDAELIQRARLLRKCTRGTSTLAIINDRADIAAVADADGVHLGQEDFPAGDARVVVGPDKLIGVSTHSIEQARSAVLNGANYLGVGPTFASQTKSFSNFPGVSLLQQVAAEIRLPAFAIGGITLENLSQVLAAGITRVAVSGAIAGSSEPRETAEEFQQRLSKDSESGSPTD